MASRVRLGAALALGLGLLMTIAVVAASVIPGSSHALPYPSRDAPHGIAVLQANDTANALRDDSRYKNCNKKHQRLNPQPLDQFPLFLTGFPMHYL
jgi:hypothetical protein